MAHVRTHLIRLGSVALVSGVMAGGVAGVAVAAPSGSSGKSDPGAVPATLAGIKAKAATDVSDRVNALNAAIAKVNAAKGLGSSQSVLLSHLGADIAPLQQLNQTVQGDTTVQQAAHDFGTIFSDYRVYALVLPASRIAAAASYATTTALPRLTADAAKVQAHVTAANQADLQPLIVDLNSQISAAATATDGLSATVLAFTPAQWNANNGLLGASKASVQAANAALGKARSDVQQMKQDLERGAGAGSSTTTPSS